MNKNIVTLIKKELLRFFTDKRMLFSLILPGLMIFVLYSVMGNMTERLTSVEDDYTYQVYVINQPDELKSLNTVDIYDIELTELDAFDQTILDKISEEEIDLFIVYDENFYDNIIVDDYSGDTPQVEIYFNSTSNESSEIYSYYMTSLNQIESNLSNRFDINAGSNTYNLASEDDVSIQFIVTLLPFLLMTFLFSGAMSVSTESIAGEKERGTIATLLMTPTKRSEIALGKIISLSIITLVSAFSSFLGLMLSLPKLLNGASVSINMYGMGTYALLLAVLITTVFIYVVLLAIISAYAKTIKEASSLALPFMLINMLIGISSMIGISSTNVFSYFVPLYNSVQSIVAILSLEVVPLHLGITIISNLVVVGLGVWILTKLFNSEKVMFNK